MPLTEIIAQELVATLDGDGDPQAVLERHAGSKGPLYAALARVTVQATARFGEVRGKLREAKVRSREAERRAAAAGKRLAAADAALAKRQVLIDRAHALQAAGFKADALGRLGEALADAARAEGKPSGEVVAGFLDAASDWRRLAELRAQVAVAQQQAAQAEREAQERVAAAKLTERAVRAAAYLARRKVSTAAVEGRQAVAAKLGLADEALATSLARALEEHGSLEAARQAWSAAVAKLRADDAKLTGEVAALRRERDGLTASIAAVRDAGIAEVQEVADAAAADVRRAAAKFERVQTQAAELAKHVRMAQALASEDPAMWQRVEPETWAGLLAHLLRWADARLIAGVDVEPPEAVKDRLQDQVRYSYTRGAIRLTLPQLVGWLEAGLQGAPMRGGRALLGGRNNTARLHA